MPFSPEAAAAQVQERLKVLGTQVHDIETERLISEHTLEAINKAHEKITQEGRLTAFNQQKLKGMYMKAAQEALKEEELLRQALTKINEIRTICSERRIQAKNMGQKETFHKGALMKMLQVSAQTLPLWVGKPGSKPPPLCGATPADSSYVAKPGDMVAGLVKNEDWEEDQWILAQIVLFNPSTKKYEVDDIDDEQKPRHILSKRRVVPLPLMRANPATDPDALFPKGATIMALYPQTTCFYKGIINQRPSSPSDDYEVLFEDNSYPEGYAPPLSVAQRYIIDIKDRIDQLFSQFFF